MNHVKPYLKSLAAGVVSGATAAIPLVDDGVTPSEALMILVALLVGSGVTYAVPNKGKVPDVRPLSPEQLAQYEALYATRQRVREVTEAIREEEREADKATKRGAGNASRGRRQGK